MAICERKTPFTAFSSTSSGVEVFVTKIKIFFPFHRPLLLFLSIPTLSLSTRCPMYFHDDMKRQTNFNRIFSEETQQAKCLSETLQQKKFFLREARWNVKLCLKLRNCSFTYIRRLSMDGRGGEDNFVPWRSSFAILIIVSTTPTFFSHFTNVFKNEMTKETREDS